jgi:hypothetical protein
LVSNSILAPYWRDSKSWNSLNHFAQPFCPFYQLRTIIVGKAQAQIVVETAGGGKFVPGAEADLVRFSFG